MDGGMNKSINLQFNSAAAGCQPHLHRSHVIGVHVEGAWQVEGGGEDSGLPFDSSLET